MKKPKHVVAVERLHAEVDQAIEPLAQKHGPRLRCNKGCTGCCIDDLTVFEAEAARIQHHHDELLRTETPAPEGQCAFLDEAGACRIYPDRPYVCRTQGLPLRWWDEGPDGPAEFRDICALNELDGPPLVELNADHCWTLGPYEG
ncbi:MAG: YkgJ family cysteine cluster protein, partial [Myxococcota bacterium]